MNDKRHVQIVVTGRVQGVSFRAYTQQLAKGLGLVGFARNRPDGSVEIEAQGGSTAIESLCDWVRHGPSLARVDHRSVLELPLDESLTEFDIR